MHIAYFGKKRPKVVMIDKGQGEQPVKLTFDPFKAIDVPDDIGAQLLENAPDIFKRTDSRKPLDPVKASTNGYVGDVHASEIPDLQKQRESDVKAEEGKEIDQIIEEAAKKADGDQAPAVKKPGKRGRRIIPQ